MKYSFQPINLKILDEISSWSYEGKMERIYIQPYYDNFNQDTLETRGPGGCFGYGVYEKETLKGLFEYYFYDGVMEIGLALAPKYVGQGMSKTFILEGIDFGIKTYKYELPYVQLHVDVDNLPAKYAYLKAGFITVSEADNELLMKFYL